MEKRIPQSWVGRDLVLHRDGAATWELITLREVNDFGLAYTYKEGEVDGEPVFVPWNAVSWMRPPVPEDLEGTEPNNT
jgi:hypothetical protein